ncbi:hypothetical protein LshimejAT787_0407690 [Lyophyllum shimeji]|uniref:Uncharacterized protein n=1 Tax=Lyophyllum shimeji TaxID=47721 RepID=A0A9P3ULK3_LYOSH|nr:hypothetical protein LshimejAT787_0407690 [Lyophyllum shimeji]
MPKLRLKRTPEEEAAHQLRKKRRKEAKRQRKHGFSDNYSESSHKRPRQEDSTSRPWALSDDEPLEDDDREPGPSHARYRSTDPDYGKLQAELEEQRFRAKMFEAFEDDERLDSLEARLNDYAHVPERWRTGATSRPGRAVYDDDVGMDDFLKMDPRYMDDEEYAEWIRLGMYRKTHAAEYAEQQRQKEMKARRRDEERARKAETQRLEKLAEEERRRKKLERAERKQQYAREDYEIRWKALLSGRGEDDADSATRKLGFADIPWPVLPAHRHLSLEHLTKEAILEFLIPSTASREADKKERKERLRETFLRFHPDKFEGRFMRLVEDSERDAVRGAIGQVVRSLNALMSENS